MPNEMKLGSADWNLWPIGINYETTFPLFSKLGIQYVEIGIYKPTEELVKERQQSISNLQMNHNIEVSAALFSLTPERWPNGAFSNMKSS